MPVQATAVMLGVEDLARSKEFTERGWAARSIKTIPPSCRSSSATDRRPWPCTNASSGAGRRRLVGGIRLSRRVIPLHRLDAR